MGSDRLEEDRRVLAEIAARTGAPYVQICDLCHFLRTRPEDQEELYVPALTALVQAVLAEEFGEVLGRDEEAISRLYHNVMQYLIPAMCMAPEIPRYSEALWLLYTNRPRRSLRHLRDLGLLSRDENTRAASIAELGKWARAKSCQMAFRSLTPIIVGLLLDDCGRVRETAYTLLIYFFSERSDVQSDLFEKLEASNISAALRTKIRQNVLTRTADQDRKPLFELPFSGGAESSSIKPNAEGLPAKRATSGLGIHSRPGARGLEPLQHALPQNSRIVPANAQAHGQAHGQVHGQASGQAGGAQTKTRPQIRTRSQTRPRVVSDFKPLPKSEVLSEQTFLERVEAGMHYFEGKETEDNWFRRLDVITAFRRAICSHFDVFNANVVADAFLKLRRGICECAQSLRSQLAIESCATIRDTAHVLGMPLSHQIFDFVFDPLAKVASMAKKVTSSAANETILKLLQFSATTTRAQFGVIASVSRSAKSHARPEAFLWLKTAVLSESLPSLVPFEGEVVAICIAAINDASPEGRARGRELFYALEEVWPAVAAKVEPKLSKVALKYLRPGALPAPAVRSFSAPPLVRAPQAAIRTPSPHVPTPHVPTPDVPTPDVPTPHVPTPDVAAPHVPMPDVATPPDVAALPQLDSPRLGSPLGLPRSPLLVMPRLRTSRAKSPLSDSASDTSASPRADSPSSHASAVPQSPRLRLASSSPARPAPLGDLSNQLGELSIMRVESPFLDALDEFDLDDPDEVKDACEFDLPQLLKAVSLARPRNCPQILSIILKHSHLNLTEDLFLNVQAAFQESKSISESEGYTWLLRQIRGFSSEQERASGARESDESEDRSMQVEDSSENSAQSSISVASIATSTSSAISAVKPLNEADLKHVVQDMSAGTATADDLKSLAVVLWSTVKGGGPLPIQAAAAVCKQRSALNLDLCECILPYLEAGHRSEAECMAGLVVLRLLLSLKRAYDGQVLSISECARTLLQLSKRFGHSLEIRHTLLSVADLVALKAPQPNENVFEELIEDEPSVFALQLATRFLKSQNGLSSDNEAMQPLRRLVRRGLASCEAEVRYQVYSMLRMCRESDGVLYAELTSSLNGPQKQLARSM